MEWCKIVEAWLAVDGKPNIPIRRVSRIFAEIEQYIALNSIIIAPFGIMRTRSQKRPGAQI